MEGVAGPEGAAVRTSFFDRRFLPHLIAVGASYAALLIAMAVFGDVWRTFQVVHGFWYASFVLLVYFALRSGLIREMDRRAGWRIGLVIFLTALAMQLAFFVREPALSQDILRLEDRGQRMLDGQFPYRDFQPNKPPLYIWMVGLISLPFGPDQIVFRTVFSVLNALIPAVMVMMGKDIDGNGRIGWPFTGAVLGHGFFTGAFIYAFCPITILEVGSAGHFDPSVVLMTLLSFWALAKDRYALSGLLLGAGLSLKVYPLFALPIFLLAVPRWRERIAFLLSFSIVPMASAVPLLIVYPEGILGYIEYQTVEWYSGVGLMSIFEYAMDTIGLPTSMGFLAMSGLLFFGGAYIYLRGLFPGPTRRELDFVVAISAFFALYLVNFTFVTLLANAEGASAWAVGILIMAITIAEFGAFAIVYTRWPPGRIEWGRTSLRGLMSSKIPIGKVPLLTSAVVLLLLLVSAQFHPWYLLWIIPFLSWAPSYWSIPLMVLFGMLQSHVYYPVDIGRF